MEQEKQQQQQITGWAQINLTPDLSVSALVHFLNVLNQRLVTVEDNVYIVGDDKKQRSISEIYDEQAKAEAEAQARAEQLQAENTEKE